MCFSMEIFVLSYVNNLCIYSRVSSSQLDSESIRAQQTSMFYSYIVLLIYVNETIYLLENLPFFKIQVNHFMAWDDSPDAKIISKCILWVRGLVPFSEF